MANATIPTTADRGDILKRLLTTLVCMIFLEVAGLLIQLSALFQYGYLLAARRRSEPLRRFTNTLSHYAYRVMRYVTLNENARPFPFARFPDDAECENPAGQVLFK